MGDGTLIDNALSSFIEGLEQDINQSQQTPSDWIQKHFYVPDVRDPVTGERKLLPGPIILSDLQCRIIDEALSKDEKGNLKYSTIVYSAPKKSGKSAVASAVALWAAHHNPNSFIACISNDLRQADNRLYGPIRTAFRLHKQQEGLFKNVNDTISGVTLPNFTRVEPIPCDAAGEAGAQPLLTLWSEIWGFDTERKKQLYTEMTIPPTLYGRAFRWIESYAGYVGVSEILEQLYQVGFTEGTPHPDFLDIEGRDGPVVRTNERIGVFAYWDTEPRMPWQTEEYYTQERALLPLSEFKRIHQNAWVSSSGSFIQEEWWDACENENLPVLQSPDVPVVVGIDMAETRDCAAMVAVTRDPFSPSNKIAIRAVRIFNPAEFGGIIDQEMLIRPVIEEWASKWNVVCWVYDPREMAKLAQDLTRDGVGWFKKFGQGNPRAVADKALHDMVVSKQISWNRDTTYGDIGYKGDKSECLYRHMTLAGSEIRGDSYRLVKLSRATKIDGAVAASQASRIAMELVIGNSEFDSDSLIRLYQKNTINEQEFIKRMHQRHPELVDRIKHGQLPY